MTETNRRFVVTFDPRPVATVRALDGLKRMSLTYARKVIDQAARIPKRGRIIDVDTLAEAAA